MELKGKRVLVTGGAGFIGSHLCDELIERGATVLALDNLLTGRESNLSKAKTSRQFSFSRIDCNDPDALGGAFEAFRPELVLHYAAVLGVKRVMEEPLLVLNDIDGLKHLLRLCKEFDVKKVVYASSSEAYGHSRALPLLEEQADVTYHEPQSQNLYAIVKLMGEKMMNIYTMMHALPTCSLRFFNVFGPRQESSAYGFVVGVFMEQAIRGEPLTIYGDGYQTRDFVYVRDNVNMGLLALSSEKTAGEVINIGVGRQTTIKDLAERVIRISGKDLGIRYLPARPYEIMYRAPDVTRMRRLLGPIEDRFDEHLRATYGSYLARVGSPAAVG